jgi:hypothetical protein
MEVVRWQRVHKIVCQGGPDQPGCAEMRAELELGPADCAACDFPGLLLSNLAAWEVIQATGTALFDGFGGLNLSNAREVCESRGHAWDRAMLTKIIRTAAALSEKEEDAAEDGEEQ